MNPDFQQTNLTVIQIKIGRINFLIFLSTRAGAICRGQPGTGGRPTRSQTGGCLLSFDTKWTPEMFAEENSRHSSDICQIFHFSRAENHTRSSRNLDPGQKNSPPRTVSWRVFKRALRHDRRTNPRITIARKFSGQDTGNSQ